MGRLLCENRRAREWAGWEPLITLEEGLGATAEWRRQHLSDRDAKTYQV